MCELPHPAIKKEMVCVEALPFFNLDICTGKLTRVPTLKNTIYCAILSEQIVGRPFGVPISY